MNKQHPLEWIEGHIMRASRVITGLNERVGKEGEETSEHKIKNS
jgi:hypothetical protein